MAVRKILQLVAVIVFVCPSAVRAAPAPEKSTAPDKITTPQSQNDRLGLLVPRLEALEKRLNELSQSPAALQKEKELSNLESKLAAEEYDRGFNIANTIEESVDRKIASVLAIAAIALTLGGWLVYGVLTRASAAKLKKEHQSRLQNEKTLFIAMRARVLLTLGFQYWRDYENLKSKKPVEPEKQYLNNCLFFSKQAIGYLDQPLLEDEKFSSTYFAETLCLAKNNLAHYLAENKDPGDQELAIRLVNNIRETVKDLRTTGDPRWSEMQETYAKVVLTYCRDPVKTIEACKILEELTSNTSLPEDWRQSIREKYRDHCPALT